MQFLKPKPWVFSVKPSWIMQKRLLAHDTCSPQAWEMLCSPASGLLTLGARLMEQPL